jgi:LuxR family maltose regulon positive regulatory protein
MQQHALLTTKLNIPPTRPGLVSRPRLIERLNAALPTPGDFPRTRDAFSRALTLISAPAGFGKTTLLSEWVQAMSGIAAMSSTAAMGGATPPIAIAWLSVDDGPPDRRLANH